MRSYGSLEKPLALGTPSTSSGSVGSSKAPSIIQSTDEPNVQQISLRTLLFNFVLLYSIGVAAEVIPNWTGTVKRGFFCDDEDIMYPYREDTFSSMFLFTYCTLLPFVVIVLVELYRLRRDRSSPDPVSYRFRNSTVPGVIVRSFIYFSYCQIGFVTVIVLTNTTKCVAGRLRPHFLAVCKPTGTNCSLNPMGFEQSYTCTGDAAMVANARKSFFSGHSSFSMYSTIWAVLFLQARLNRLGGNKVIVPMIQTLLLAMGLSICYSRVSDYMHHWSDVLIGIFVGSFIAAYSCLCWAGLFRTTSFAGSHQINSPFMLMDDGRRDSITSPIENISSQEADLEQGVSTTHTIQKV